jgi:hypothetical protein
MTTGSAIGIGLHPALVVEQHRIAGGTVNDGGSSDLHGARCRGRRHAAHSVDPSCSGPEPVARNNATAP